MVCDIGYKGTADGRWFVAKEDSTGNESRRGMRRLREDTPGSDVHVGPDAALTIDLNTSEYTYRRDSSGRAMQSLRQGRPPPNAAAHGHRVPPRSLPASSRLRSFGQLSESTFRCSTYTDTAAFGVARRTKPVCRHHYAISMSSMARYQEEVRRYLVARAAKKALESRSVPRHLGISGTSQLKGSTTSPVSPEGPCLPHLPTSSEVMAPEHQVEEMGTMSEDDAETLGMYAALACERLE
jgi:hypothetical protein